MPDSFGSFWVSFFFWSFGLGLTAAMLPLLHVDIGSRLLRYLASTSLGLVLLGTVLMRNSILGSLPDAAPVDIFFFVIPIAVGVADLLILVEAGRASDFRILRPVIELMFLLAIFFFGLRILGWNLRKESLPPLWCRELPVAAIVTGGAVLGFGLNTMLLGHSYLVNARLPFEHLLRFSKLFIVSLGVRAVVVALMLFLVVGIDGLWRRIQEAMQTDALVGILPLVRVLVGLVFPLILGVMAYKCAKIRANQSATGIMYVATGFVIIGELTSFYLMFRTPFPL